MDNTLAFAAFLEKWGTQYASLKNTLTRLKEHQDILDKFEIGEIYSADELDIWVEDWLWLHSKLNHPLDIMYFKPYWVPIQKHSYEYMVDLSAGTNEIFETNYISIKPYAWAQGFKFPTPFILNALPEKLDDVVNLFLDIKERTKLDFFNDFMGNRDTAAYRGDLEVEPVTFEEVFDTSIEVTEEEQVIIKPPFVRKGSEIHLTGVNVLAIGLLPFETPIQHEVDVHDFGGERYTDNIMNIRDMVYYLRGHGFKGINELKASVPGTDTKFYYNKNTLQITNLSQGLINSFKFSFEELQNN